MKSILRMVVGAFLGIGLLIAGLTALNSDQVSCGSQTMSRGDVCSETSNGSTVDRTYDEQKADNERTGWILTGAGSVILVGSLVVLGVGVVRRNRVPGPAPAGR